jgi:hypothetical protein
MRLDDAVKVTGAGGYLSGRTEGLPVDDRGETRAMMREVVFAVMRCRS